MASVITREIVEIVASMQAKALAFDSEHPNHPLGTRSAGRICRGHPGPCFGARAAPGWRIDVRCRCAGYGPACALRRGHAARDVGRF